ncbi:hypothetical protein GH714_032928 [Hevea brasiliensis]|uniref:Cytochrome P450 n=1 Tax=Hevea brasiliensis TaxID=3981 RepID=A0A6A6LM87_HEVBR|nr:hypothetical protein GH714_032928 [Hevea brasiliensis]
MKAVVRYGGVSNPGDFMPILNWIDSGYFKKKVISLAEEIDKFFLCLMDEHRNEESLGLERKNTMIDHLLSLQELQPDYCIDEIIKGLILIMLVAGTDTLAVTLEWAMSNLLNHPSIMRKTRDEIENQVGQECLDKPHLSKDPTIWDDPTSFKPERFDGGEGEAHKLMPFGLGKRSCPGSGLAQRVVDLTIGSLIQCFERERASDKKIDMIEGRGTIMPKAERLKAKCKTLPITKKILLPQVQPI